MLYSCTIYPYDNLNTILKYPYPFKIVTDFSNQFCEPQSNYPTGSAIFSERAGIVQYSQNYIQFTNDYKLANTRNGKPPSAVRSAVSSLMLCCGLCGNMSKRDYKVATTDGVELEPLGGIDATSNNKEHLTNGNNKTGEFLD